MKFADTTVQIPDTLPRAQFDARQNTRVDVLVIGAGPTGLACAIEAQKAGFKVIVIDKGCLVLDLCVWMISCRFVVMMIRNGASDSWRWCG